MLIDATHPEETRVVVLSGKRLEEFDVETASKRQIKSNIYLAKVTRVEPSLQACFVDYGGNRHGFLAFSEIHPDYYRIPVADREALMAEQAAFERRGGPIADFDSVVPPAGLASEVGSDTASLADRNAAVSDADADGQDEAVRDAARAESDDHGDGNNGHHDHGHGDDGHEDHGPDNQDHGHPDHGSRDQGGGNGSAARPGSDSDTAVETVSGEEDAGDDDRPRRMRMARRYKIQEVIKRRQIMLVQVTKEERGNKGAALTTYLSLAGRYCVLMPNTDRGGGISRRINSPGDRKRLKSVLEELEIPRGMAVIIRTAGAERSKAEIRRDYEYLLRLWDEIRELTLKSTAPALIYEEASLIKRAIRDMYSRDIEEIIVDGDEGYKAAKAFMRMLTPSHAKRVQQYKDTQVPLFHHYQVESQLDTIHNPVVQLKSGGYIVLNQTEALVAIDVNSGRSTRERNIEETALRTNLEAAEEVARQLRLRDLAGLIVIDFIDMDEARHNAAVERKLKEAMRVDRARIQMGRISPFGLLELSRQRMRPSVFEGSMEVCRQCRGTGSVRSTESTALHVLRSIEEEAIRHRSNGGMSVLVPTEVALYILNQKRSSLAEVESRHGLHIFLASDDSLIPPDFRVERLEMAVVPLVRAPVVVQATMPERADDRDEDAQEQPEEAREHAEEAPAAAGDAENGHGGRRRSRRRRRGGRREDGRPEQRAERAGAERVAGEDDAEAHAPHARGDEAPRGDRPAGDDEADAEGAPPDSAEDSVGEASAADGQDGEARRRRRGRRGGRRRSRRGDQPGAGEPREGDSGGQPAEAAHQEDHAPETHETAYSEWTPAEPAEAPAAYAAFEQRESVAEMAAPSASGQEESDRPNPESDAPEPAAAPAARIEQAHGDDLPETAPDEDDADEIPAPGAQTNSRSGLPEDRRDPAGETSDESEDGPRRGWWRRLVT